MRRASFAIFLIIGALFLGILGLSLVGITKPNSALGETQPIPNTELIEFLPDPPQGWVRKVEGTIITAKGWSMAEGTYNASINPDFEGFDAYVGIIDYGSKVSEQEFWDRLPEPEGERKTVTIKGFQAREEYVKDVNYYILQVNIHNHFLVVITTSWDREMLYYFADSIDYNALATLEKDIEGGKMPGFEVGFDVIASFAIGYIVLKSSKGRKKQ